MKNGIFGKADLLGSALLLLLTATALSAQTRVPLLVDTGWLASHLQDRNLVILHVGTQADFDAGHIPGARLISEEDLSNPHDMSKMATELMLELPPADALRRTLAARGVSDDSQVVVYLGKSSTVPSATRVLFTLDYLGLGDQSSLLNGGLDAWTRAGKSASTAAAPAVPPGRLTARPTKAVVADAQLVKSLPGRAGFRLVDARAPVFYRGIEAPMGEKGHIPGAVNIPFSDLSDNLQMIDRARAEALFTAAGVKPGDTVVAYCHVGQQATAVVFAARLLGHPVMLYDGSFQEWAMLRNPVER